MFQRNKSIVVTNTSHRLWHKVQVLDIKPGSKLLEFGKKDIFLSRITSVCPNWWEICTYFPNTEEWTTATNVMLSLLSVLNCSNSSAVQVSLLLPDRGYRLDNLIVISEEKSTQLDERHQDILANAVKMSPKETAFHCCRNGKTCSSYNYVFKEHLSITLRN